MSEVRRRGMDRPPRSRILRRFLCITLKPVVIFLAEGAIFGNLVALLFRTFPGPEQKFNVTAGILIALAAILTINPFLAIMRDEPILPYWGLWGLIGRLSLLADDFLCSLWKKAEREEEAITGGRGETLLRPSDDPRKERARS